MKAFNGLLIFLSLFVTFSLCESNEEYEDDGKCHDEYCPDGYKCSPVTNDCDCEETVRCRMLCFHGWKKDKNGCEVCACAPPCKNETCPKGNYCSTVTNECDCENLDWCTGLNCPYGFETDHNECEVCFCKEKTPCKDCDVTTTTTTTKKPWWRKVADVFKRKKN